MMSIRKMDSTAPVTPKEFLRELLRPAAKGAVAWCLTMPRAKGDWTGAACDREKPPRCEGRNSYYSIAAFPPDADAREIKQALGAGVVLLDDVTTKGDYDGVLERLGPPSFKVQTSARSQQWGYLLDELADDAQIAPIHARLQKLGLCDRNGNSLVRYGRLPAGVNNKPEHGELFDVRCVYWKPQRRFAVRDIEEALGVERMAVVRQDDHERHSDDELEDLIRTGESFHGPMTQLTCRAVVRGQETPKQIISRLRKLMLDSDEEGTDRWQKTYDDIPRMVDSALEKFPDAAVRARLRREGKAIIADEENMRLVFEHDPVMQGLVRYDEFAMQRVLTRPVPGDERVVASDDAVYPRHWRDEDTVAMQQYVQRSYVSKIGRDKVDGALAAWVRSRWAFHPVREYLRKLGWDGRPRLGDWLASYMGAQGAPPEYLSAVGSKWIISAVARILDPGCQADYMLVIEGAQGRRKSTALRVLAGADYFSDSMPHDLESKDAADHLRGKWIVELNELEQFRKSEIETVKAFITRRVERFRPAYGRNEIAYPRQCVFAGTTNSDHYLVDDTGNRRFWPVTCDRIEIRRLKRDRDQLWAEAVVRYEKGERWYLDEEVEGLAAKQTEKRKVRDPWHDEIVTLLSRGELRNKNELRPGHVLTALGVPTEKFTAQQAVRVGRILRVLGWPKKPTNSKVYVRPL